MKENKKELAELMSEYLIARKNFITFGEDVSRLFHGDMFMSQRLPEVADKLLISLISNIDPTIDKKHIRAYINAMCGEYGDIAYGLSKNEKDFISTLNYDIDDCEKFIGFILDKKYIEDAKIKMDMLNKKCLDISHKIDKIDANLQNMPIEKNKLEDDLRGLNIKIANLSKKIDGGK